MRLIKLITFMVVISIANLYSFAADDFESAPTREELLARPNVKGALTAIDAWIEGNRIYDQIPGISVGIVHNQELLWSKSYGYANLESLRPADADTLYSVCSISKVFTAIGVMQLRDKGQLYLRDPVSKHLSWFDIKQQHEQSGPVTIEGLLTHSSGLPREARFDYWANDLDFPTRDQLINSVGEQETLYPAHRYFQYSNLGFTLAGEIIQALSGQDYTEYMEENVLIPLRLNDTRTHYPEELRGQQLAIGYDGLGRSRSREPTEPFFTKAITPAAGYTSSVNDLAKFIIWQFKLLDGAEEHVLNPHTLQEMHRVHWVNPDWSATWGLGFVARRQGERTLAGHTGSCPGYQTNFSMDVDKRLGVIVLTNAGDGQPARLVDNIIATLRPELEKPAPDSEEEIPDLSVFEANFSNQHWGGETAVRQWGNGMVAISIPSRSLTMQKLKHDQDNRFYRENDIGLRNAVISIELDQSGEAYRMKTNDSYRYSID